MNSEEFKKRRRQLMRMVGQGGIVILPAAPVRMRSRDVEYRFRQDSDFFYMTGFAEPEAVAVLVPGRANGEYLLFCREKDQKREQWDGLRAGQEGATAAARCAAGSAPTNQWSSGAAGAAVSSRWSPWPPLLVWRRGALWHLWPSS